MSNIDSGTQAKFKLLDKIIKVLSAAKKVSSAEIDVQAKKIKKEVLIDGIGCSEEIADKYITQAKERI